MRLRLIPAGTAIVTAALWVAVPITAHADDTRQCNPWYGYSVCYQSSDDTWWMCNPDCGQIPPPVRPFPGLPPELPLDAPPPPAPKPAPPPPPWSTPPPYFPGCEVIDGCTAPFFFTVPYIGPS